MLKITSTYYSIYLGIGLRKLCGLFLLLTLIISCKKTFTSTQFVDDKLVVLAELTAGDSMEIPIGKTIKVGNGGLIRFEKVNNATVTITDESAHTFNLLPNWSAQYAANPTTVFTNRRHFRSNATYSIEIQHPTLGMVTASTFIPQAPKLISVDTAGERYLGKEALAAEITWQDEGTSDKYYIIEALKESVIISRYFYYRGIRYNYDISSGRMLYEQVKNLPAVKLLRDTLPQNKFTRINLYTADNLVTENSSIDNLANPFRRIFIPGRNLNGRVFSTKVFLDREFFTSTDIKNKGRVRLQLKSVGKELYTYLLVYEKYKTDFGSVPASQLISPAGNVQNGLGIFGGSARKEEIYYFDTF
ncbi:MAG: hypothetical protein JWP81_2282 [Ferruginibacter sp.]|nr:hypothetical protein [Ferruginibacter sp.]